MIANLLELNEGCQDGPSALDAFRTIDLAQHHLDGLLIKRRLLGGEGGILLRFHTCGQIADDFRIGLQTTEDERLNQPAESFRLGLITMTLNGNGELLPEFSRRSQISRIQKFHDRPEFGQAILDRGAGQGGPALRLEHADHLRLLGRRVLDVLRFIQHHPMPGHAAERFLIATHQPVGRDDNILSADDRIKLLTNRPVGSVADVNGKGWSESIQFSHPVSDQRGGDDQQRRSRPLI